MRITSRLASVVFGMAIAACAMPTGLLDLTASATDVAKRDAAGTDRESALVARGTGHDSTVGARSYDDASQSLEKRDKLTIEDNTGRGGKRGGRMTESQSEIWLPIIEQFAHQANVKKVDIVYRPHSGADTSSADEEEHVTVKIPTKSELVHIYPDGRSTLSIQAERKQEKLEQKQAKKDQKKGGSSHGKGKETQNKD
ncbi:hypothetical protein MCOR27_009709 [Pyricularia oryzae]|nr:hypothetical protein MCOR27_009709 [Pyricularia oryzae]KAI6273053.1 hypothetical protein MCOR26_007057 [Pyricularia oryzae]KAI6310503.1 hypothetical protein MCOR30_011097 [Pyricularia oryzae]KAI6339090.1 hypothetical protein MCOR28_007507 [Pyricularia oryzae]KAI6356055.1 hypothetical protein MCOR32_010075 [Pyricularia oryzae]